MIKYKIGWKSTVSNYRCNDTDKVKSNDPDNYGEMVCRENATRFSTMSTVDMRKPWAFYTMEMPLHRYENNIFL